RDRELNPTFGTEGQNARGGKARLPLPSRGLPPEEVAQVRGASDALALWVRHHDAKLHARFQPQGAMARAVFEAAEQARVEAIGANRMAGVSRNLDAMLEERCRARGYANVQQPGEGALPDIIGLMVREKLTGKPPPPSAAAMVDALRPWVEDK